MLFKMIHWILTLQPDSPAELSERAKLYEDMGNPIRAVKDWERCIANISDHEGVDKIRARIDILKTKRSRIHYNRKCSGLKWKLNRKTGAEYSKWAKVDGGTKLDEFSEYGITWAVMADPDGNEFCLVRHS